MSLPCCKEAARILFNLDRLSLMHRLASGRFPETKFTNSHRRIKALTRNVEKLGDSLKRRGFTKQSRRRFFLLLAHASS